MVKPQGKDLKIKIQEHDLDRLFNATTTKINYESIKFNRTNLKCMKNDEIQCYSMKNASTLRKIESVYKINPNFRIFSSRNGDCSKIRK